MIFVATIPYKKGRTTKFLHPSLLLLFLIRDPRSGIRDKHPGSATLHLGFGVFVPSYLVHECRHIGTYLFYLVQEGGEAPAEEQL